MFAHITARLAEFPGIFGESDAPRRAGRPHSI